MTTRPPKRTAAPPVVVQPDLSTSPPLVGRSGPNSSPPGPAPGQPGGGSSSPLPCITASREAKIPAAGSPEPAPGAVATRPATTPGRGRAPSPARDGLPVPREVADPSLAGSTGRTYTIPLPAGLKLLSLNDRIHFAERYRRTQELKKAAWAVARHKKIPHLERVSVVVEYQPRDRRHRDADNTCAASGKACIDGIVAAGVLVDDECPRYVESITCTIGEPYPLGRLVLHLTEVAA